MHVKVLYASYLSPLVIRGRALEIIKFQQIIILRLLRDTHPLLRCLQREINMSPCNMFLYFIHDLNKRTRRFLIIIHQLLFLRVKSPLLSFYHYYSRILQLMNSASRFRYIWHLWEFLHFLYFLSQNVFFFFHFSINSRQFFLFR